MSDGYKNILANGYMRDTNYIIIKDCDNIDELNIQWNKFLSNMTIRQQRLSDDKSIEIWNITNQQHYKIQKQQFLEKLKKKDIEGNKEIIPSNIVDLNDDTPDSIFSSGDFDEFKKDIDLNDPKYYTEDNNINLTLPDDIKDDPNDNAMEFNQDSTMSIVGNIAGNNVEDKLKNLEKEFIKFNSQSNDIKRKADDKCRELYGGSSNLDRYNKLKSEYLSNKTKDDLEPKDFIPSIEPQDNSDNDEIKCNEKICRCHYNDSSAVTEALHNDSFIARCYSAYILNSINEASDHKEMKRLEDVPYFTPQELIDLGVHGNNNYYSKMSDNDGLTKDISISTWFDSYKDLSMNHIFEDYRKEWINKLNELYSDYYDIRDEDKLLARKQSILDLGWNPEIPFTNENRIKASDRVNEIFKQTIPNDVFIDMNNIPESDDCLSETVDNSHEPVFLVLTKGKTPIISQGIKFVTKSEYSHASITFDPKLEEVYSFNMRKESFGFVRENKSSFKENFISVFAFFAPKNIVNKLKETVYDFGNHKTTFDLKIFANKIFHINHKASNNEYNQVCSTFVDTVLQSGGINLVGDQKIPAPSDIYNGAKSEPNKIFEVYNGIAPKYDGKKVKRQINYLRTNQDTLSINEEKIETFISTNPFENSIVLYHGSPISNLKKIKPVSLNNGTRFSSMRKSSFWTKNIKYAIFIDILRLVQELEIGHCEHMMDNCITVITKDNITSDDIIKKIINKKIYVYEKEIPKKYIGRGHCARQDEYSIDVDVIPSKIHEYNVSEVINDINIQVLTLGTEEEKEYTNKKNDFWNNKKSLINHIVYRDRDDYLKIKSKYKKDLKESFSFVNESIKDSEEESKKSVNESSDIYYISEGDDIMVKYIYESNDRSKFEKDYISKNKLDLNSFKKVRFKDSKNISEYINNNKFLSSKKGQDLINKYADGYIWIDEDNKEIVGYVAVDYKWKSICPIELYPKYRNHGLSKPIMKIAINELGAEWLYVYTDNEVAINLYKTLGFKITGKYGKKYAMALPGTESYDKMMPVKEEYDTLNIIEESVNSDIYLNIEDLESGKSNVLLVTGYSGSGKSTLSHKLSKDHGYIEAPLDDFDERLVGAAELTEFPIIEEYFKSHKVLDIDYKKEDPYTNKDFIRAHDEFIKWCITKSSPNRKIIIEGIQIYLFVSSDLVKKYPIIIKGTSFSKSMKRRIIRNIKAIDDPKDKFIHFFKTIKNLSNHTGDIKTLRDFKKSVNESFSYINEDYTFVKDKNKDNLYLKGKELYDSLSKHDKEFLGGHYIDSKNIYYRKIYTSGKDITGFGELYIFDSSPNDAVLMYAVSPDYRNKGLSNKILNDIFDFCKKDKNIHSIIWRANKNNDASNYLANKYKMKLIRSDDRDNKYSMTFNESFSFVNEVKKFPVEFDDNGNLTIYKCRMGNISYGDEIDDSSELLESYRNTNNIEGMKYEVSRLWFIISDIEKKMTKRIDSKKYDEYVRNRATATNIFKHNLEYLMKMDKDFNFAEYYNTTPFSNNSVKITNNTLKYSMKTLQQFIMK